MNHSGTFPTIPLFRQFVVGMVVVFGCRPAFSEETMPISAHDLGIEVRQGGIGVGSSVLCSIFALERFLENEPRIMPVVVNTSPDVDTAIHLRVLEVLRAAGFEHVSVAGSGSPGWALYPLPAKVEFPGCEE